MCILCSTVEPPIKDTLKEDKAPNKEQAKIALVYLLLDRKSPLKEDNLSIKDKTADPECVLQLQWGILHIATFAMHNTKCGYKKNQQSFLDYH